MEGGEKWLFVLNPKAGRKNRLDVHQLIIDALPNKTAYEILTWDHPERFGHINQAIRSGRFTYVVAAGGDGTVNRVGAEVAGTEAFLGILPFGSGNGLARTLGLSMDPAFALKQLLEKRTTRIDAGEVNGRPFFCTAGMGFDAHIGGLFAQSETRGLQTYVRIVVRELFRYKAKEYKVTVDGQTLTMPAFLITVANAGQYGNDFFIAPQASVQDGVLQTVIMKPFNLMKAPGIIRKILGKKAFLSSSIVTVKGSLVTIERGEEGLIHFDGEPAAEGRTLRFAIHPLRLKVLTGPAFPISRGSEENVPAR